MHGSGQTYFLLWTFLGLYPPVNYLKHVSIVTSQLEQSDDSIPFYEAGPYSLTFHPA